MDSLVAEGLGKFYNLGQGQDKEPKTVGERLLARLGVGRRASQRQFWALRDVSFRVQPGTILGLIGANGAGKTTLLKVLARVITPSTGRVTGIGRVVSLLELGAGFDPDLSARENVLMNAAMLGIPRSEALRRMDDILEFAEVAAFVDRPLKHYSSGMYLRLAFSVAINMNPQILLADEILAVGDINFQERCLQRVEEAGTKGLTVLFVSHDMDAILRVCNRVMWLNGGEIVKDGDPEEVVDEYQNAVWARADAAGSEKGRHVNRLAEIISVRLVSSADKDIGAAPIQEDVYVKVRFRTVKPGVWVRSAVDLHARNQFLFRATDANSPSLADAGIYEAAVKIPANFLSGMTYNVSISLVVGRDNEGGKAYPLTMYNALSFLAYTLEDVGNPIDRSGRLQKTGLLAPQLDWTIRQEQDARSH
jgi:ABC-type polysaccharide/polyol phosphate transport system ATPase subunit